jgi:hypothetical protein
MKLCPRPASLYSAGLPSTELLSRASQAAILLLALICTCAATLAASPLEGRITGKVTDPQSVVVAGAQSRLVNAAGLVISEQ